jgi:CheY-like chemotaxis protein
MEVETRTSSSGSVRPAARGRILVIDDEPAVGRTLLRLLGTQYDVTVLCEGQQALDLFADGALFDIIICDLTMPDLSGMDIYQQCSKRSPELAQRFVFMTGGTFTTESREFLDTVANMYIEKPFDLQTIRQLVKARVG